MQVFVQKIQYLVPTLLVVRQDLKLLSAVNVSLMQKTVSLRLMASANVSVRYMNNCMKETKYIRSKQNSG